MADQKTPAPADLMKAVKAALKEPIRVLGGPDTEIDFQARRAIAAMQAYGQSEGVTQADRDAAQAYLDDPRHQMMPAYSAGIPNARQIMHEHFARYRRASCVGMGEGSDKADDGCCQSCGFDGLGDFQDGLCRRCTPQPDPRDASPLDEFLESELRRLVSAQRAKIERLREALKPFANEMTFDEVMNNPPEHDWAAMTAEERIRHLGVRKMERDTAILAARQALANSEGKANGS